MAIEIDKNSTHGWNYLGYHNENILFQARLLKNKVNLMMLAYVTTKL